jgi:hypothetical protein
VTVAEAPQPRANAVPGHMPPVRVAVHRTVTADRWERIINAVAEIASNTEHKQQVAGANFLATHAPTPDEMAEGDPYAPKTMLAGPEVVDGWVAQLAYRLGVPEDKIVPAVQALLSAGEAAKEPGA